VKERWKGKNSKPGCAGDPSKLLRRTNAEKHEHWRTLGTYREVKNKSTSTLSYKFFFCHLISNTRCIIWL